MAVIIDILEDTTTPVQPPFPAFRSVTYTARENGGTMYHHTSGESASGVPLTPETDLYPPSTAIAQFLYDQAAANGDPIPDLVTKVYIEKKRRLYFLQAWEVLRDEMTTAPLGTGILNDVLAELAGDAQAADFFEAMAWRMGLTATISTQLTPTVVGDMSPANQRILFQLILGFMGLGLTVGNTGNTILEEFLNQS